MALLAAVTAVPIVLVTEPVVGGVLVVPCAGFGPTYSGHCLHTVLGGLKKICSTLQKLKFKSTLLKHGMLL